jgi:ADP-ribose pyrophosphatase
VSLADKQYEAGELIEEQLDTRRIYDGRILNLRVDSVKLPDGRISSREVVEHVVAVVILAENDRGEILMIKQFRYPVGEVVIELPAGIVEPGEEYCDAAVRELQEETGWKPAKLEKIGEFYTSPGFCSELLVMYYATGLSRDEKPADDDEFIIARFLPEDAVLRLAEEGRIKDAKSLYGVYWWLRRNAASAGGQ